jgi:hypothetical protein
MVQTVQMSMGCEARGSTHKRIIRPAQGLIGLFFQCLSHLKYFGKASGKRELVSNLFESTHKRIIRLDGFVNCLGAGVGKPDRAQ